MESEEEVERLMQGINRINIINETAVELQQQVGTIYENDTPTNFIGNRLPPSSP